MINVRFLGHACFEIDTGREKLLIDPYLNENPYAPVKAEDISADYIFVTHGHVDHVGDTALIASACGAKIVSSADILNALFFPYECIPMNLGGRVDFPFGSVKQIQALHGSGVNGAPASGFLFDINGTKIYHAGDTALMKDFELLRDDHVDLALLPIGDVYTMGPEDAVKAAKMIGAKMNIPMHYKTFPNLVQDPGIFGDLCKTNHVPVTILEPGESYQL